jgi:thiol-disulfide isomerase/thioredoxin
MRTLSPVVLALAVLGAGLCRAEDASPPPWHTSYTSALQAAREANKPLLVKFYADWCAPCRKLAASTLKSKTFRAQADQWVLVSVDVDKDAPLADRFGVQTIPDVRFLTADEKELGRISGYVSTKKFVAEMKKAREKAGTPPGAEKAAAAGALRKDTAGTKGKGPCAGTAPCPHGGKECAGKDPATCAARKGSCKDAAGTGAKQKGGCCPGDPKAAASKRPPKSKKAEPAPEPPGGDAASPAAEPAGDPEGEGRQ